MGILAHTGPSQTHIIHQLLHLLVNITAIGKTVIEQRLSQSLIDSHTRVKRSVGILKNHLHALPPWHQLR